MYRISTVSGSQQGCEQAKQMIERIVVEQSSAGVMGGGQGGQQQHYSSTPHGGQQHQGQQQGQSAEWAAYYAAQAAAQQQQQYAASATQTAPAPAPAGPAQAATGADAYYEQFFRYAYYYGEEAARAYYGAWSPPAGTPNPYGVNPAGIQPAPAPAPAPAPTSTPAPAAQPPMASSADRGPSAPESSQTSTRETSRRKVSNLPSWMTKGQS
jgi:far upstream element-binding protein